MAELWSALRPGVAFSRASFDRKVLHNLPEYRIISRTRLGQGAEGIELCVDCSSSL